MAQPYVAPLGLWRAVVVKRLFANNAPGWTNTYNFIIPSGADPMPTDQFFVDLVNFEGALSYPEVEVNSVIVRPWSVGKRPPGPAPYSFISPAGVGGYASGPPMNLAGGYGVGRDVCQVLQFQGNGRIARQNLYYRGALKQSDVEINAVGQQWTRTGSTWQAAINTLVNQYLAKYMAGGNGAQQLVVVRKVYAGNPKVIASVNYYPVESMADAGILQRASTHRR